MASVIVPLGLRLAEIVTLILGIGLSTIAVFSRMYAKLFLYKAVLWEDCFSVLAWMGYLAFVGIGIVVGQNDSGAVHIAFLSSVQVILYGPVIVFVKVSILLQYINVFSPLWRGVLFYCAHGLLWLNVLYYLMSTFIDIFRCAPIQRQWDPSIPGKCFYTQHFEIPSGALNVVSDISILVLPWPLIWRLQLSTKKKLGVTAIFGVGVFACIASIMRMVYSTKLVYGGEFASLIEDYWVFHGIELIKLSFAEIAAGIVAGCLPVLPRIFRKRKGPSPCNPTVQDCSIEQGPSSWRSVIGNGNQPSSTTRENEAPEMYSSLRRRSYNVGSSGNNSNSPALYIEPTVLPNSSWYLSMTDLLRRPSEVRQHAQLSLARMEADEEEDRFQREVWAIGEAF
ncbi:hypothetical protein MMC11_006748 [Xylographa trunciseda]|nr:hypothetical protein [Xylographa trunciseda]